MTEKFADILTAGGHTNSLGRADEVIGVVLNDKARLAELYDCLFNEDAWVRMRAADAFEKICRVYPGWIAPYIDKFSNELFASTQPSIQWHLAQMYGRVELTADQKHVAIQWLEGLLSSAKTDWIVAANAMDTLAAFTRDGTFSLKQMIRLLEVQQQHASKSVVKRADKIRAELLAREL